jgi:hypothetical protein
MRLTLDQWMTVLVGIVFAGGGVHAFVTRKVAVGDDGEAPQLWLYGWRAVAVGIGGFVVAALCFADATGIIHMEWK